MDAGKVQILLSTWNGGHWLEELLESLRCQTYQNWQLLVRDDASSDQTLRVLLDWQQQYPDKVAGLLLDGSHLGSNQSFSRLVEASDAPYLMFCDQDDVWFPEKVELQYTALRLLEGEYGAETPLLVHSDLAVVDVHRHLKASSFWEYRRFDVQQRKQAYLLNNVVTGCATLFNRAAATLAFPAPQEAMQHDRWLGLVCAWFGVVHALPHPLLFYRQHEANQLGAAATTGIQGTNERVNAWSAQAGAFLHRYADRLSVEDYKLVEALADLRHMSRWERRQHILRHRLFKQGILANLALLLFA
jgi:glycosyltransferase involved in cell wall biosynthesis